jgi:ATP-dependent RNA helicase DDX10/DBP4
MANMSAPGKRDAHSIQLKNKSHSKKRKRSDIEDDNIRAILNTITEQAPPRGSNPLAISNPENPTYATARKFDELPISQYTKKALKDAKFVSLTAIQRAALPHALCGRDVLGAAKTGSGKTLAFVIPVSLYTHESTSTTICCNSTRNT